MLILLSLYITGIANAEEWLSGARYLRTVSVDILGRAPTMDEYEQVEEGGEIPDELLEQWLSSEDFARRTSRFHRQFLWNNTTFLALQSIDSGIGEIDGIWKGPFRDMTYRGVQLVHQATCGDFEA